MLNRIRVVAAALILSPALGSSLAGLNSQALVPGQTGTRRVAPGAPLVPRWKLGAAVSFENLTIFPVTASTWADTDQFMTLDAGLKSGQVKITEMGADGQQNHGAPAETRSHAEVNSLSLGNHSGKPLILLAGEMLLGGQQDRIDASDRIVLPAEKPTALAVFCVEPGRWNGAEQFGLTSRADRLGSSPGGPSGGVGSAGGIGAGTGAGAGAGVGAGAGTGVGAGVASSNGGTSGSTGGQASAGASTGAINTLAIAASPKDGAVAGMANAKVREKAEVSKDQTQVWNSVNVTANSTMVLTKSGSLQHVYDDKKVSDHLDRYIRAFKERLAGKNVVGVVVAVDGKVQLADVFASPSLFQAYWPKLLKSYALEALSSGKRKARGVPTVEARSFLSPAEGEASVENEDGAYRLVRHSSDGGDSSFELEYTGSSAPILVHFNRISNK